LSSRLDEEEIPLVADVAFLIKYRLVKVRPAREIWWVFLHQERGEAWYAALPVLGIAKGGEGGVCF
jgi:hypothetical protein